jgi:spore coat protein U-like protein
MFSGTTRLEYNLYLDRYHTAIWGDRSGSTDRYYDGNPPTGRTVSITVYGRIFALQDVKVGTYTDSLLVTMNF